MMSAVDKPRSTFGTQLAETEFCSNCGTVLLLPKHKIVSSTIINCVSCGQKVPASQFDGITAHTTLEFNSRELAKKAYLKSKTKQEDAIGPVVERKCWKCGHDKMSYATLQTRSADEGQTVFYTCVKCGAQDNENS